MKLLLTLALADLLAVLIIINMLRKAPRHDGEDW